jgi:hypothetical protein
MLGYLGGMPIEWPYNAISIVCLILYFYLGLLLSGNSVSSTFQKIAEKLHITIQTIKKISK